MAKPKKANPWLEHYYNTFAFIAKNSEFNQNICSDGNVNLCVDPKGVVSSILSKLKKQKEFRSETKEINIPQIEIPIIDKRNERDAKGNNLRKKHRATFLIGGYMDFDTHKISHLKQYSFSICITFSTICSAEPPAKPSKCSNIDSCCLSTCGDQKRVVRRIHFDYQPGDHHTRPLHFQIGGRFPEDPSYSGVHYCSEHFLEKPRIPYKAEDFVCLFDYMIHEFNTPLDKWREDSQWKQLVKESKDLLKSIE